MAGSPGGARGVQGLGPTRPLLLRDEAGRSSSHRSHTGRLPFLGGLHGTAGLASWSGVRWRPRLGKRLAFLSAQRRESQVSQETRHTGARCLLSECARGSHVSAHGCLGFPSTEEEGALLGLWGAEAPGGPGGSCTPSPAPPTLLSLLPTHKPDSRGGSCHFSGRVCFHCRIF